MERIILFFAKAEKIILFCNVQEFFKKIKPLNNSYGMKNV
jgi:hypothetical protein